VTLTKDQIVAAIATRTRETRTISLPEWGGDVSIRRLLAGDLEASGIMERSDEDAMLKAIALSVCDEGAEPLFGLEQVDELRQLDAIVVVKLFAAIAKFNGMGTPELEEMVAAFDEAPLDDSSSD
jgi:hypothetical protein